MLIPVLMFTVLALGLAAFSVWKVPSWRERSFGTRNFKWGLLIALSAVVSVVTATTGFILSGNPWIGAMIGLLGFLATLSTVTDITILKLPSELSTLIQFLPVPLIVLFWPSFDYMDKLSMISWGIIVFIFAILSQLRLFGWGDVKLMFAFGTLLSWWVGVQNMTYAFMAATVVTLIFTILAKQFGFNFGVKKTIKETATWDENEKKMVAVEDENDSGKKAKKRTYTPFGPGLLISYLVMALWAAATVPVEVYTWFDKIPA